MWKARKDLTATRTLIIHVYRSHQRKNNLYNHILVVSKIVLILLGINIGIREIIQSNVFKTYNNKD